MPDFTLLTHTTCTGVCFYCGPDVFLSFGHYTSLCPNAPSCLIWLPRWLPDMAQERFEETHLSPGSFLYGQNQTVDMNCTCWFRFESHDQDYQCIYSIMKNEVHSSNRNNPVTAMYYYFSSSISSEFPVCGSEALF